MCPEQCQQFRLNPPTGGANAPGAITAANRAEVISSERSSVGSIPSRGTVLTLTVSPTVSIIAGLIVYGSLAVLREFGDTRGCVGEFRC